MNGPDLLINTAGNSALTGATASIESGYGTFAENAINTLATDPVHQMTLTPSNENAANILTFGSKYGNIPIGAAVGLTKPLVVAGMFPIWEVAYAPVGSNEVSNDYSAFPIYQKKLRSRLSGNTGEFSPSIFATMVPTSDGKSIDVISLGEYNGNTGYFESSPNYNPDVVFFNKTFLPSVRGALAVLTATAIKGPEEGHDSVGGQLTAFGGHVLGIALDALHNSLPTDLNTHSLHAQSDGAKVASQILSAGSEKVLPFATQAIRVPVNENGLRVVIRPEQVGLSGLTIPVVNPEQIKLAHAATAMIAMGATIRSTGVSTGEVTEQVQQGLSW